MAPVECNSLVAARALLLASDRVMLSSAHQVHHELATGQLAALPHPSGRVVRAIGLTTRRHWQPTGAQRELIDELRRHAGRFVASSEVPAQPGSEPAAVRNARGETRIRRVKKRVK